ncbi:hypothetical protein CCH79_00007958 [Gambusia affinis]|uniref:EF-hand domain-containing protein n=1 Tax=Gambusia affinis TaxID=33528 RepID=A0A315W239_GAMAF|nr:hypothetical protein CCH79_00007958 [Gambusia affinis]
MTLEEFVASSVAERLSSDEGAIGKLRRWNRCSSPVCKPCGVGEQEHLGRLLSCGMDDGPGQDDYEERLKEVFNSFDTSGCGSLSPEELSDLCQSLHLDDAAPTLIHTLLQNQDLFTVRVSKLPFVFLSYKSLIAWFLS